MTQDIWFSAFCLCFEIAQIFVTYKHKKSARNEIVWWMKWRQRSKVLLRRLLTWNQCLKEVQSTFGKNVYRNIPYRRFKSWFRCTDKQIWVFLIWIHCVQSLEILWFLVHIENCHDLKSLTYNFHSKFTKYILQKQPKKNMKNLAW